MSDETYRSYESLLWNNGFQPSGRLIQHSPNWQRSAPTNEIARVYINGEGSFKAYRADGLLMCAGVAAWELRGCL